MTCLHEARLVANALRKDVMHAYSLRRLITSIYRSSYIIWLRGTAGGLTEHKERVEMLRAMYKRMLEKLEGHDPAHLPEGIDMRKLESAYDELLGYEFVLKKIS